MNVRESTISHPHDSKRPRTVHLTNDNREPGDRNPRTASGVTIRVSNPMTTNTDIDADLARLDDHLLVLGYGELTEPVLIELRENRDIDIDIVVITPDEAAADRLDDRDVYVLIADPSDEEPLRRAGLTRARAIIAATNDDAGDAFAILTACQLHPNARIVAGATNRENIDKLRRAGADTVISPANIGGRLLVNSALGRSDMEVLADRILEATETAEDE